MRFSDYDIQTLEDRVEGIGPVLHIRVKKRSGRGGITWDALQKIKNEAAGEDAVAIEVYPPEHEVVYDTNMRHLWVLPPGFPLPSLTWRR
jgi:hypothetical protein